MSRVTEPSPRSPSPGCGRRKRHGLHRCVDALARGNLRSDTIRLGSSSGADRNADLLRRWEHEFVVARNFSGFVQQWRRFFMRSAGTVHSAPCGRLPQTSPPRCMVHHFVIETSTIRGWNWKHGDARPPCAKLTAGVTRDWQCGPPRLAYRISGRRFRG